MFPHETLGACMPSPKNDKPDFTIPLAVVALIVEEVTIVNEILGPVKKVEGCDKRICAIAA